MDGSFTEELGLSATYGDAMCHVIDREGRRLIDRRHYVLFESENRMATKIPHSLARLT